VMMTSQPPLFYWESTSIDLMKAVTALRRGNIEACYTLDAGPNVHVLCTSKFAHVVKTRLEQMTGVERVIIAAVGGPARIIN